jgi:hypothetical protein
LQIVEQAATAAGSTEPVPDQVADDGAGGDGGVQYQDQGQEGVDADCDGGPWDRAQIHLCPLRDNALARIRWSRILQIRSPEVW